MAATIPTDEELDAKRQNLMSSPAYFDQLHPDHERLKAAIAKDFEIVFENQAHGRMVNPIVIDTTTKD